MADSNATDNKPKTGGFLTQDRLFNGVDTELVDARELHFSLGIGREFANWIKERISQLGLIDGRDFMRVDRRPNQGSERKSFDYLLLPIEALRISLSEKSDRGRYTSVTEKLKRENGQLTKQVAAYIAHVVKTRPEVAQIIRYHGMENLGSDEKARLMGWSGGADQWLQSIAELTALGLVPSLDSDTEAESALV